MKSERLKAWLVHLFTASGVITVFMALIAAAENDFRAAMLWLIAAQLIDGVDGTLAR
ncbi:MAG: phosphatidylcholine/phosphatidylserine synthase, partial [Bacteroidetes bacterium]|nr:phosphatidylcholine/phosphatidylserine synthase [Bacteroidota bacterium]